MPEDVQFEMLVDAQGNIFQEYLSSVIAKRNRDDEDYRNIQAEINAIYEQYPKVLSVFDTERAAALTEQECAALIKVMSLRSELGDLELQTAYFRGCYDGVGYLKKAGIL